MADPVDLFDGLLAPGQSGGRASDTPIRIAPLTGVSAAQIQAWPGKRETLQTALAPVGVTLPKGRALIDTGRRLCGRIAPGRFLVLADGSLAEIAAAVRPEVGALADLSHARAGVRVSGPKVEDLLSKGAAIDFDPAAFPPGTLAQTAIHHMGTLILRRGDDVFDLFVLTSFALSFAEWLTDASREFGWVIDPPATIDLAPEPTTAR